MTATPDEPSVTPRRERRWLPVVIVTLLLVVVAGGARSVADATATEVGPVMMGAVRVQPAEGWQTEGSVTPTFVRLHKGPVVLDITVGGPVPGGSILLATAYREQRLESAFADLYPVAPEPVLLLDGVPATRFAYLGVTGDGVVLQGLVVAVTTADTSVVFDARGPTGDFPGAIEDIRTMIEGATL